MVQQWVYVVTERTDWDGNFSVIGVYYGLEAAQKSCTRGTWILDSKDELEYRWHNYSSNIEIRRAELIAQ